MIESLAAFECGFHKNPQIVFDFFLSDIFGEFGRAQRQFNLRFVIQSVAISAAAARAATGDLELRIWNLLA